MSAIWGTLNYNNPVPENCNGLMRSHYEENCRIDRFEDVRTETFYAGCGIQYITSEAEKEQLPFFDETRNIIFTADCVLDNRTELLSALDETDPSLPDGMLLYRAYLNWGIECTGHLRGLFSFAVYEGNTETLYLAADPLSTRCLYYYKDGASVSFSTLLQPLLNLHPEITFNEEYLKDFACAPGLMPNLFPCDTPYKNVYKVNSGTYLKITRDDIREFTYWTPANPIDIGPCTTAEDYGKAFRRLFESCVSDALRSRGNIGISLSSGLDSSSVGTVAADILAKENKPLFTYTYVPCEAPTETHIHGHVYDETDEVKAIAALHPNMVTHFLNNNGNNCVDSIPEGVRTMEIPYKAYVNLPSLYEIYETAASKGCRIVLTGQLGNITISHGYIDNVLYDLYHNKKYLTFFRYLNRYCIQNKESRKKALKGCLSLFRRADKAYSGSAQDFHPDNPFLAPKLLSSYPISAQMRRAGFETPEKLPHEQKLYRKGMLRTAAYTYLGELDTKAGLKYGVLLRDPTRDMRMLNFCYHLPFYLFAYQGTPRWLIRGNLSDMLPKDLLAQWMRYSVQNADWQTRISRDWTTLAPRLKNALHEETLADYIDRDKLDYFFLHTEEGLSPKAADLLQPLLILYVLGEFIKK